MIGDVPEYECTLCGLPSVYASMGGPGICPACDCGWFRDGQHWTYEEALLAGGNPEQRAEFKRRAGQRGVL